EISPIRQRCAATLSQPLLIGGLVACRTLICHVFTPQERPKDPHLYRQPVKVFLLDGGSCGRSRLSVRPPGRGSWLESAYASLSFGDDWFFSSCKCEGTQTRIGMRDRLPRAKYGTKVRRKGRRLTCLSPLPS